MRESDTTLFVATKHLTQDSRSDACNLVIVRETAYIIVGLGKLMRNPGFLV